MLKHHHLHALSLRSARDQDVLTGREHDFGQEIIYLRIVLMSPLYNIIEENTASF